MSQNKTCTDMAYRYIGSILVARQQLLLNLKGTFLRIFSVYCCITSFI